MGMGVKTVGDIRRVMEERGITEKQAISDFRDVLGIRVERVDDLTPDQVAIIGAKMAENEEQIKRTLDALDRALGHADEMQRYFKDVSMRRVAA